MKRAILLILPVSLVLMGFLPDRSQWDPTATQSEPVLFERVTTPVSIVVQVPATTLCTTISVAGLFQDPSGNFGPQFTGLWRWTVAGANNDYVLGHNYGAGAFILGLRRGDLLCYAGQRWRVSEVRTLNSYDRGAIDWALASQPGPTLNLQTCVTADVRWVRVVRAVPSH
jgi:hypothetical protein